MAPASDDESGEPRPRVLQRSRPYLNEQMITDLKPNRVLTQSRDQQGAIHVFNMVWAVSDVLGFPNRTRCTAMELYHRVRLYYPDIDYNIADVGLASLFTASKFEDTLKKSLEIQAVAYNIRYSGDDPINSDSPVLEEQHRRIIGIERQILEACSFDFRTRHHQPFLIKFSKFYNVSKPITALAWLIAIDAHKTLACLKATPQELALASLIIAARLRGIRLGVTQSSTTTPSSATNSPIDPSATMSPGNFAPSTGPAVPVVYDKWKTNFAAVLETCHDILDLYTDHLHHTFVGPRNGADAFIRVRIELNREAKNEGISPNNNNLGAGMPPASPVTPGNYGYGPPYSDSNGNANGRADRERGRRERDGEEEIVVTAGDKIRGGAKGQQLTDRSLHGSVRFTLSKKREDEEWKAINKAVERGEL
ncbi:RNA polymerase II C-terminal domain kinase beta subunit [Orbilia oligospora]|nr:RNA polymerase II C-terminal domain kinase beta subunit [Orbilia oligospora]